MVCSLAFPPPAYIFGLNCPNILARTWQQFCKEETGGDSQSVTNLPAKRIPLLPNPRWSKSVCHFCSLWRKSLEAVMWLYCIVWGVPHAKIRMWQRTLFAQLLSLQIGNNNNTKLQIGFLVLNGCYCPFFFPIVFQKTQCSVEKWNTKIRLVLLQIIQKISLICDILNLFPKLVGLSNSIAHNQSFIEQKKFCLEQVLETS